MFTKEEIKEFDITDEEFKALPFDHRMGLIRRLRSHGDSQEGSSEAEHKRKAKPFFARADELHAFSGIMKVS